MNRKTDKSDKSVRIPKDLQDVAIFLYISGGRALYNFLEHNMPLPSCSSVRRYISSFDPILEGELRIQELKKFLKDNNLPTKLWVSDDSTGLVNRIRYDRKTNKVVGFVLPYDDNGMPKSNSFLATSAKAIENYFKKEKPARLLYTSIVQPLAKNAPFFCLLMNGTDDKYDFEIVCRRWLYIRKRLQEEGIELVGRSTDGDPRAFKVMRLECGLIYGYMASMCDIEEFKARLRPELVLMQDTVHIGAKLKARFLKTSIILAMGNYSASIAHLKILITSVPKDEHCLTFKDVHSVDKMNFDSVLRLCHPRVIECLKEYIVDCDGTVQYLKLIHFVLYSFLDADLAVEKRIYSIWYCVFFLRVWRAWLLKHEKYSTDDNFITLKTYICIEINAHGLYNMVLRHIDMNSFEDFFPYMYGSQPCESFYRLMRSLTSIFLTMVNCDLLDAMNRVKKIELLCKIANKDFGENAIIFPRNSQFRSSFDRIDKKKIWQSFSE